MFSFSVSLNAQSNQKAQDKAAIKAMLGCYDVEFKYTETFAPEVDYEQAYDYTSAAFEWAELIEETDDKIVIQHLLIINDSMIIKHWRQDWIYENNEIYTYDKDNQWSFNKLKNKEVKGTWTQNVYQVDDSPRYAGIATWVHADGISSWYNKADSPLPRREYSKRSDYNVMKRGNRVQITDYGWLHEQDNDKIIREDGKEDVLLVQEKGYNTYKKRPDNDCDSASKWWKDNKAMWVGVRDKWNDVLSEKQDIKLNAEVDDKKLFEHLFYSRKTWDKKEVGELIDQYLVKTK
ncbi:hypothetical protein GCM10007940_15510 [Portibacter lacus]|uniref:Uncharacterized protein n=1 Tax=Portibacter lacus TaxID=1099794 RepID=A0AA37SM22_9BACT|nr:hypothetical protein GCM10007940_15510 [Portibacter lacus]